MSAETANKHKAGIYIFTPAGEKVGEIPAAADMVTNCTFGGADLKTLIITADKWKGDVISAFRLAGERPNWGMRKD